MYKKSPVLLYCYFSLALVLFYPSVSWATEEYAKETGKECASCHIDPSGGSELTEEGKEFQKGLDSEIDGSHKISKGISLIRFISGYLHILTAVFWFGTILYVHIVLKPAYAAGGLPKGEVRVGLVSMVIMLVTGIILTIIRVNSFQTLVSTRFGILLLIKISLFLIMMLAALVAVFFIGPKLRKVVGAGKHGTPEDMTPEELAYYDGKDGRPGYVGYGDTIYDVSKSGIWYGGVHFFKHPAGADLTRFLTQAPHGEEKILKMPKVGQLVDSNVKNENLKFKKLFYFLAYFNLTLVFLIILILALWRWWI
jgi:predicted heme/steroid binding protein